MKVVVTRAPRIKKMLRNLVAYETYVISNGILEGEYLIEVLHRPARAIGRISLPYNLNLLAYEVIPFDSFEDMCKWVAGGKKMEDLQGDSESEWTTSSDVPIGTIFSCKFTDCELFYAKVSELGFLDLETGEVSDIFVDNIWPLGAGDTITITAP